MDEEQKAESRKTLRNNLLFLAFTLAVIGVIAYIEFGRGEIPDRISAGDINLLYLLGGVGCFVLMLGSEFVKYSHLLKVSEHKTYNADGLHCAVIGKFYDNITPAGFGGQPFQIRFLKKRGCSDGVSGSVPILGFLGLQFSFVLIALTVFIFKSDVFFDRISMQIAAWAGLLMYSIVPVCVVLFSIVPKPLLRLIKRGTAFLGKIRLIKDPQTAYERAVEALESYKGSVEQFAHKPGSIALVAVTSMIFRAAMLMMPWFVLTAFGAQLNFLDCFCRIAYIYAVITLIPTPGNSGAAEASFYSVFALLPSGSVFWAMLVWRLLCYYSWLISGAGHYLSKTVSERNGANHKK